MVNLLYRDCEREIRGAVGYAPDKIFNFKIASYSQQENSESKQNKRTIRAFLSRMLKMLKAKFYHQHTKIPITSKISNAKNFDTQLQ